MFGRGVWLAFGLALTIAGSAEAQGDLDQGKSAAQLYASACAACHKSPQSVSTTKWLFGLESFLREHYTSSSKSAAILAAYLKGHAKMAVEPQSGRGARHVNQVSSSQVFSGSQVSGSQVSGSQVSGSHVSSSHVSSSQVSSPKVNEFGEEIPRPPADIPDVKPQN